MVSEPEPVVRLTRLRVELAADCAAMDARSAEVAELVDRWDKGGSLGRPELVLLDSHNSLLRMSRDYRIPATRGRSPRFA